MFSELSRAGLKAGNRSHLLQLPLPLPPLLLLPPLLPLLLLLPPLLLVWVQQCSDKPSSSHMPV
jgi:hypothetical protein